MLARSSQFCDLVSVKSLQQKLQAGRFVITAEVTPPVLGRPRRIAGKALPLKGLADAVNITDGAGARPHLGAVTSAAILIEQGIEPGAATHLPRPQPHRVAERPAERGGLRRTKSADVARRRPERRRPARRQAGVRSRSAPVAGNRPPPARPRRVAVGPQSPGVRISSSAAPTIRSIRRRAGRPPG